MDADVRALLERGVTALEKLSEDPVISVETGPPVCPHCERVNPTVRASETEATGAMAEVVCQFHCLHCNQVFYGIPMLWSTVATVQQAADVIQERAEIGGYDHS